ncbi:amino acid permease [Streptomyces sp. NPDC048290]|uniref:amino acid permease n=1 Tax=Streptomyces sp. NPDC048290 TaxID=3155811 RepID=UPI00342FA692
MIPTPHTSPHPAGAEADIDTDADARELAAFGYRQQLKRELGFWTNFGLGFAFVSPVVGLYSIVGAGMFASGPAWIWALLIALSGQILLALVFAELASQFPVSGGIYQWSRRLVGPRYGWFAGWLYAWTQIITFASVSYLGGFWMAELFGRTPGAREQLLWGFGVLLLVTAVNLLGQNPLKYSVNVGIAAELVASVAIGLILLVFFAAHDWSVFFHTLGAADNWQGSSTGGFLAAIAVAGWAFVGFDACSAVSEEVKDPRRHVPRALLMSLVVVGLVIVMNAVAVVQAERSLTGLVQVLTVDPLTPLVTDSFGGWVAKPFQGVVLASFVACSIAIQTTGTRTLFSLSRDRALPFSDRLQKVARNQVPANAVLTTTVIGAAILCVGLNGSAVSTLIAFTSGGFYASFTLAAVAALWARLRGRWDPRLGTFHLRGWGLPVNVIAVLWVCFETVNIAWPRPQLLAAGAPWYLEWAVPLIGLVLTVTGVLYLARHPRPGGPEIPVMAPRPPDPATTARG